MGYTVEGLYKKFQSVLKSIKSEICDSNLGDTLYNKKSHNPVRVGGNNSGIEDGSGYPLPG